MEIQEHDKKDDRRTEKTKKYLAVALRELIIEKGYETVTIQEIIDRANIGRSTFYAHYENKEELLLGNINFQKHLVNTPLNDAENFPMGINLYYLFNHTKENIDLMDSMAGTKTVCVVANYFAELCAAKICEFYKSDRPDVWSEKPLIRYQAEAVAGGIVRMLFKWLDDGALIPVNEMVAYSKKLLTRCMNDYD